MISTVNGSNSYSVPLHSVFLFKLFFAKGCNKCPTPFYWKDCRYLFSSIVSTNAIQPTQACSTSYIIILIGKFMYTMGDWGGMNESMTELYTIFFNDSMTSQCSFTLQLVYHFQNRIFQFEQLCTRLRYLELKPSTKTKRHFSFTCPCNAVFIITDIMARPLYFQWWTVYSKVIILISFQKFMASLSVR